MNAKGLRIENWVNYKNQPVQIDASDFAEIEHDENYFDVISPIPLTEEWLLKLGFSDKEYKAGYIGIDVNNTDFVLTKPKIMGDWHNYYNWEFKCTWPKFIELQYVHQLQNLYFALTGEELTIK